MTTYLNHRRATCNFIELADVLVNYLTRKGVEFNNGMPRMPMEALVKSVPNGMTMIPSSKRSTSKTPEKTILCNYEVDDYLYCHARHIVKGIKKGDEALAKVIAPYRPFFAVAGFDLSISPGMDKREQNMLFLINWMLDATLAINGVPIILNLRVGNELQAERFAGFPKGLCYALGRLGEEKKALYLDEYLTRLRILFARPGKILVYGYRKSSSIPLFDEFGVEYECFEDYRHATFELKREGM